MNEIVPSHEQFRFYTGLVLVVMAVSILAAFALSTWLQQRISGPILKLADTASKITEHRDYGLRAQKLRDDEIGLLTDSFNDMLSQIQTQDSALRARIEQMEAEIIQSSQQAKAANEQLRTANQELESFSYSISHDLRAPLRGLDGFSQALLEDYGDKLGENGQDLLQRIRAGSQRMDRLIDDLLNLSRMSRGELHHEHVDLSAMASDVADGLRKRDPQRHVELRIADDLQTNGDPHLLRVALENLLGNAWKYTSKRMDATIEFGLDQSKGNSSFFVRDDGVGFDMQYANKLFAPFQRLHGMGEFPGTGVGLATVQRIIRRHGGRVWAQAELNKGATFYFTLS